MGWKDSGHTLPNSVGDLLQHVRHVEDRTFRIGWKWQHDAAAAREKEPKSKKRMIGSRHCASEEGVGERYVCESMMNNLGQGGGVRKDSANPFTMMWFVLIMRSKWPVFLEYNMAVLPTKSNNIVNRCRFALGTPILNECLNDSFIFR